jgi:diguanylate cyclase (GGDEF)-like protein/PAS domain S-box-containing protein
VFVLAGVATAGAAAILAAAASRRATATSRRGWESLSAAAIVWALGALAGTIENGGAQLGPLRAGAAIAAAALALAGVLRLHGAPARRWGQARTVVDGLIVAGSALLIGWTLGLGDVYAQAAGDDRLTVVTTLADLTLAACLLVMLTRCRPAARARLGLVGGGFAALALADAGLAYIAIGGSVGALALLCAGWPAGWLLVGAAARREAVDDSQLEPGLPGHASVFVPSIPFGLAVIAAAIAVAGGDEGFVIVDAAALIVLVVARQVFALLENISYWQRLEAKIEARTEDVRRSEALFRSVVQNSSDLITVLSPQGEVQYQSPSLRTIFGYDPHDLDGVDPIAMIHPDDAPAVVEAARDLSTRSGGTRWAEYRVRHKDGSWRHVEALGSNLTNDPQIGAYVLNTRDISDRKQLEEQLTHGVLRDPLTGLANRALFADRVGQALRRAARDKGICAVLFCDLDDFKRVNDRFGHAAGDELLCAVARRLIDCVRPGDTVARFGGDEFAILLEQLTEVVEAARVAERIQAGLAEPFAVADRDVIARASIGVSTTAAAGDSVSQLLHTADVAMYTAKEQGKGLYEVYGPSMHATLTERLDLERDFREAVENEHFELRYQPIISLKTGRIRGLEALVRWRHPRRGILEPASFIQLAEDTGLIVPIGREVLRQACAQARSWQQRFRLAPPVTMAVNVSARQLTDPGLIDDVITALTESGLPPSLLVLELTESVLVDENEATASRLRELRAHGVQIAIDDFGTGYASLSYLRRLPIDILKVDRVFVREIVPGSSGAAFAEAIVAMGRSLGLTPVAEGIETAEQAGELTRMGCDLAQGYRFAPPQDPDRIAELLAAGRIDPAGPAPRSSALSSSRRPG